MIKFLLIILSDMLSDCLTAVHAFLENCTLKLFLETCSNKMIIIVIILFIIIIIITQFFRLTSNVSPKQAVK